MVALDHACAVTEPGFPRGGTNALSRKWFGKIEESLCGGRGSIIDHIWRFEEFSGGVEEMNGPSLAIGGARKKKR